ncbi:MAG: PorT family protein [Flavobacteriales bacterium]|nr:PorT family protein [Flavobacteriales bacterium]
MKKITFLLSAFAMIGLTALAQTPQPGETPVAKAVKKVKRQDQIMLDIHGSQILRQEGQGVKNKWYSYGFTFQLMWDQPIKKTPISLGAGLGVSNNNYFIDRQVNRGLVNDTYFTPFADPYKRYKLSTTHIEIPLELRFRFKPDRRNTFKVNLGFNVGYLLMAKTKYVGQGENYGVSTDKVKIKEYNIPGINNLKYGVYTRIGYSRYAITAHYQISEFFRPDKGPKGWNPITVGFTIVPF